jgi:hypothetical protein
MSKKKKFSKRPDIPVASSYHFYSLDQVVEWGLVQLDPKKKEKRNKHRQKEIEKLEKKGKLVISIY